MDSLWTAFGISIALLIYINSLLYKEWDVVNDQYVAMTEKGASNYMSIRLPFSALEWDAHFCYGHDDEIQTYVLVNRSLGLLPAITLYTGLTDLSRSLHYCSCRCLADSWYHYGKGLPDGQATSPATCLKTCSIPHHILNSGWPWCPCSSVCRRRSLHF